MSALQLESGACPVCQDTGEVHIRTCGHQGNCPCEEYVVLGCECGADPDPCRCGDEDCSRPSGHATTCSICERPVAEGWTIPLCPRCQETGKAIARQVNDEARFRREYGVEA